MIYYSYFSLFLVLLKGRYELFSPLDSRWTGGELLLYSLDLPRVDYLFAFTETVQNTQHIRNAKWSAGEYQSICTIDILQYTHSGDSCTSNCYVHDRPVSKGEHTVLEGKLGRRRCVL